MHQTLKNMDWKIIILLCLVRFTTANRTKTVIWTSL